MDVRATWLSLLVVPMVIGGLFTGLFMILGARRMMRLESHGWALAASILALLPCAGPFGLLGLAIGIWSLIVLNRSDVRAAFVAQRAVRLGHPLSSAAIARKESSSNSAFLWVLAILVLVLVCPLGIAAMLMGSYVTHVERSVPQQSFNASPPTLPSEQMMTRQVGWRGWDWGPEGPAVYEPLARSGMGLDDHGIEDVNEILRSFHQEYLDQEAKHRKQERTADGHLVTTISPIETADLENRLWSRLDKVLATPEHQKIARLNLRLGPRSQYGPEIGMSMDQNAAPGLFGWGAGGGRVEIWRVGSWYSWRVRGNATPSLSHEMEDRGPTLPYEYQRFWTEPTLEKSPAEQTPAEKVPPANSNGLE